MELFAFGILESNEGSDTVKHFDMPAWRGTLEPVSAMSKRLCVEKIKIIFQVKYDLYTADTNRYQTPPASSNTNTIRRKLLRNT
jgi:hypothetical protein